MPLRTSRALVCSATGSLAITRRVCAALSRATRQALAAEPAWVTANGTITSHDVARAPPGHPPRGGRRPAVPSVISVSGPADAAPQVIGMACIVVAGNVGGDHPWPRSWPSSTKTSRTRDTPGTAAHQRPARHDA